MDSSETKRKRPSLLASQEAPETRSAQQGRILSEIEPNRPERTPARRKYAWVAVGLGILLIAVFWLVSGPDSQTTVASRDHASAPSASRPHASPAGGDPAANTQAAVIVDDDYAPAATTSSATAALAGPAASASASDDSAGLLAAMHLSDPSSAKAPAPATHHRRRRRRHKTDTDIDLLAALMAHVGAQTPGKPATHASATPESASPFVGLDAPEHSLKAQLGACPAANTAAGIHCRQKICATHRGTDPACPAPTASAN